MQPIARRAAELILSGDTTLDSSAQKIMEGCSSAYRWAMSKIVGDDILPREPPDELRAALDEIASTCEKMRSIGASRNELLLRLMLRLLANGSGTHLTPEEYYFGRALGVIEPGAEASEYDVYKASGLGM
jgi:hypothetical protein